jgi:hypothetical protein
MLRVQFDPIQSLALINQRHAELIEESKHEQLVDAAMKYAASHIQVRSRPARSRLSRVLVLALARMRDTISIAMTAGPVRRRAIGRPTTYSSSSRA